MAVTRIFLDTETTGLSVVKGDEHGRHRIVDIGCVKVRDGEIIDQFQTYLDPEREMPEDAARIHGLRRPFLRQFPVFSKVYKEFLDFIESHILVIHNANFDMAFLNAELSGLGVSKLTNPVEDTLMLARKKYPGAAASLDALCRRFRVKALSDRAYHGALLDAQLLCSVYHEMHRAQHALELGPHAELKNADTLDVGAKQSYPSHPREFPVTEEERKAHQDVLKQLTST